MVSESIPDKAEFGTVFYIYRFQFLAGPQELGGLPAASCTELGCAQKLVCLGIACGENRPRVTSEVKIFFRPKPSSHL